MAYLPQNDTHAEPILKYRQTLASLNDRDAPAGPVPLGGDGAPVAGSAAAAGDGAPATHSAGAAGNAPAFAYWDGTSLFGVERGVRAGRFLRLSTRDSAARIGGTIEHAHGTTIESCPFPALEPEALWEALPHTRPDTLRAVPRTVGTGDRLGRAGQGHATAFRRRDAAPVLAQQSVRELTHTQRTYRDVAQAAALGVIEAGYTGPFGFDGDHLKTIDEVRAAVDAGCSMLTLDLSGFLDLRGVNATGDALERAWHGVPESVRDHWFATYNGITTTVDGTRYEMTDEEVRRAAVTFYKAVGFLEEVDTLVRKKRSTPVDLEVSVDEAGVDTTIPQHYMVVRELISRGIEIASIAPKFVGEFEKAIDYRGDINAVTADIRRHAVLAQQLGGYKVSIHSGSDKFSVFPVVETATEGRYHLKTSGTFWLEAVRTIAEVAPETFRSIFEHAWDGFEAMQQHYHLSAQKTAIPPVADRSPDRYADYLTEPDARQLLHVSYSSVLHDNALRETVLDCLDGNRDRYLANVTKHTLRHIDALGIPAE